MWHKWIPNTWDHSCIVLTTTSLEKTLSTPMYHMVQERLMLMEDEPMSRSTQPGGWPATVCSDNVTSSMGTPLTKEDSILCACVVLMDEE